MATYTVTSSNWNDVSFWSSITSAPGDSLDFGTLSSAYSIDFNANTGLLSITQSGTTFTVGDSTFGGSPDATLAGASVLSDFSIDNAPDSTITTGSGDDYVNVGNDAGTDTVSTGSGEDTIQFGGSGTQVFLDGGADDDLFVRVGGTGPGNAGSIIDGGAGIDTIRLDGDNGSYTSAHHVDLSNGGLFYSANDRGTLTNFENVEIINSATQVTGDAGDNVITSTGTYNNILSGGGGADTIDAGGGNDTVTGGTGNDTLTGGSGADTFVFSAGSGTDTITDFSIAAGDQLNVSGITSALGHPVHAWNVTTVDDGSGNAKLVFPNGEEIILQGVTPAQMSTPAQYQSAGIPCFTHGTMILTPKGEVPVQSLRPGDLVSTRDNGVQPILWVSARHIGPEELALFPHLKPVEIKAQTFDANRRLIVSPQHGILLEQDKTQVLVRAIQLARMKGGKVRRMEGARSVTYVHLMFETHQVIFSNGLPSESFYPGPSARGVVHRHAARELFDIFPDLKARCAQGTARVYGDPSRSYAKTSQLPNEIDALRWVH